MQINKLLHQIGIGSALLIGTLNAKTTIQNVRGPIPHPYLDAMSSMQLRMHAIFQGKLSEIINAIQSQGDDTNVDKSLTDQECLDILDYLDKERLYDFYNNFFLNANINNYRLDEEHRIQESDRKTIQRVLECKLESKSVLFVGFDQTEPTEGSEIQHNTPGYEKSIFTSTWNSYPGENYNALKCDFLQYANLLEEFPQLNNFFDYIIIGGQTIEYIPAETWEVFGKLLKNSGLLLFTDMFQEGNISDLRNRVSVNNIGANTILSQMFYWPDVRRNYIADTIEYFIAQGAGSILSYKCHIERDENWEPLVPYNGLAAKIKNGLELSKFNNKGSHGKFHFCMNPIDLLVIEK